MSNTIYSAILPVKTTDKNKHNYVYQITELSTGIRYVGSRRSEYLPAINDLKKYQSSTKDPLFKLKLKYNPLNYHYEILSYHATRQDATIEESRLHFLYDVKCNPNYYNLSNQTSTGFCTAGKANFKDKYGTVILTDVDDLRIESGELVSIAKGTIIVKDTDGNKLQVAIDDPRFLSGELVSIHKGMAVVKDIHGNTFSISVDDERYKARELVGATKGYKHSDSTKQKISEAQMQENNAFYGKTHSDETKYKLRNQYIIDGQLYIGMQAVMDAFKISICTVSNRCKSTKFENWVAIKSRQTRL